MAGMETDATGGRPSFYLLDLDDQSSVPPGWQLPS